MGSERRRFFRVTQPFNASCRLHSDIMSTAWVTLTVLNLSAAGVRLRSEDPLNLGTTLEIQLQLPGTPQPVTVRGRVAWTQMHASGVSESGVEFIDVTPEQEIQIDQLVQFLKKSG